MIPIAANHAADIVNRFLLPCLIADVLPAGDLLKNEQAEFVAGVKEMTRLGIMRSTNDVALKLVAENLCVAALDAAGHRLPDEGEGLMTIQSAQLYDLAVQRKSVISK